MGLFPTRLLQTWNTTQSRWLKVKATEEALATADAAVAVTADVAVDVAVDVDVDVDVAVMASRGGTP